MCVLDFLHVVMCLFVYVGVPDLIKEKLAKGLPVHWRSMMKTWASYAVSSEAEIV
jgi:hypothetical protein